MCEENYSVTFKKIVLKDYCYDFAQTECTESEEIIPNDVCVFDYQPKESMARATNLEVIFEKGCDKQMVTVCDPNYYRCLLYTSPSPRDLSTSRMPSSA